jgi:hypothetical protein
MPTRNVILADCQAGIVEHLVDQSGDPDASEELRFLERREAEDASSDRERSGRRVGCYTAF